MGQTPCNKLCYIHDAIMSVSIVTVQLGDGRGGREREACCHYVSETSRAIDTSAVRAACRSQYLLVHVLCRLVSGCRKSRGRRSGTSPQLFQVPTMADRKNLYFNVVHGPAGNKTITVEGGGVNATIIQPDIAATNGMVHIINKILGVPYTTVKEKLRTDPMLNKTYHLGEMSDFNKMLDEKHTKFTYFVPRDLAWKKLEVRDPSAHRKLFMKEFTYQVKQILERHLVISDQVYTMGALKRLASNTSFLLPTMRDHLKLKVKETEKSYYVEWQGEWIHIFRPDVECTNGIIHVMDYVFMKEGDIVVTGPDGAGHQIVASASIITHLAVLGAVRWLLH